MRSYYWKQISYQSDNRWLSNHNASPFQVLYRLIATTTIIWYSFLPSIYPIIIIIFLQKLVYLTENRMIKTSRVYLLTFKVENNTYPFVTRYEHKCQKALRLSVLMWTWSNRHTHTIHFSNIRAWSKIQSTLLLHELGSDANLVASLGYTTYSASPHLPSPCWWNDFLSLLAVFVKLRSRK